MEYPELETFKQFRQIIVWGFPLHTHTHSYIHGAWVKTFKHLGFNVFWFHDKEYPKDFDYSNSCFITEGWADDNIPINASSTYFVHIAKDPSKYVSKGARLIEIRYNVFEINDFNYSYKLPTNAVHLSRHTLYEKLKDDSAVAERRGRPIKELSYEAIYMYWATDLLPHEFNYDDASATHDNEIYYLGSLGYNHPFHAFRQCAEKAGLRVIHNNPWSRPVSYEENIRLMKKSYCCPDFRSHGDADKHAQYGKMNGTNHVDIGYIPCRVLKAISYGHTGITNSPRVKEILGDYVEYAENPEDVLSLVEKRKADVEWRKRCMKHIAEQHTYLQRVRDLARAINMKDTPLTMITSIYDIGREAVDGRSMSDYKSYLLKLLSSIAEPFVIYMDKTLGWKNELLEAREKTGPIKIIETSIEDISMWKYKNKIQEIIDSSEFKNKVKYPNDITNKLAGYCMIQYSKFGFLERSISENIFNSSHFSWIDAGFSRFYNHNTIYKLKDIKLLDLFYIQADNTIIKLPALTYDNYIGTCECILHGWLWLMNANSFNAVKSEVMRIWDEEMISKNRIDNEQIALALAYKNIKTHFNLLPTKGNTASIFSDLFEIRS